MKLFDILKKDHKTVQDLIEKMLNSSERAGRTREQSFNKFKKEILQHMHGEEEVFYPFLLEDEDLKEKAFEALEEHRAVRLALPDIESKDVEDEQWKPIMKVIGEMIKHHINEEEKVVFKQASKSIDEETDERLSKEFQEAKKGAGVAI